jgi:hypothetical protein
MDVNLQVPHTIIYNSIQKFHNLNRSKEEQSILKTEISRLVNFWAKQKEQISNIITKLEKEVNNNLLIKLINN